MEFAEVLTAIREWLGSVSVPAQVRRDAEDGLWVFFESENGLAELLVSNDAYAPWQFVSMTVLDTRLPPHAAPVFTFWGNGDHTIPDILRELDRGMERFCAL